MGFFSHITNRNKPGYGPGGMGWRGWETASGQEWTPGGAMSPEDWNYNVPSPRPHGPSTTSNGRPLYGQQQIDQHNQAQQRFFNQRPDAWFSHAEYLRQDHPEYWQRWMKPLYQQFGYGTPQTAPSGQTQMVPAIMSSAFGG